MNWIGEVAAGIGALLAGAAQLITAINKCNKHNKRRK